MGKRILVSFLGQAEGYRKTTYEYEGFTCPTAYFPEFLIEYFKEKHGFEFDKVFIIGTKSSSWNKLEEYKIGNVEKIEISMHSGADSKEFWLNFQEIVSNLIDKIEKGAILYFDITHGFRTMPILSLSIINLLRLLMDIKVEGIFYGMYTSGSEKSPVINLKPLLELNNLVEAVIIFKNTGDAEYIRSHLENIYKGFDDKKNYSIIKEIYGILSTLNKAYQTNAVEVYFKKLADVEPKIQEVLKNSNEPSFYGLKLIFEDLLSHINDALRLNDGKRWEKYLYIAEKYFKDRRLDQSIIVLREAFIMWLIESCGYSMEGINYKITDGIVGELNRLGKEGDNSEEVKLASRISNIRNKVSHAFVGRGGSEEYIKGIENNVKELLEDAKGIFNREISPNIKERIKEFLRGEKDEKVNL